MELMLVVLALWMAWQWVRLPAWRWVKPPQPTACFIPPSSKVAHSQRKPPWVRRELIRLKALSPGLGCRTLAECFNRQFGERGESVGKNLVAYVLRQSRADVMRLRRSLKHRVPRPMPRNRIWAMDLTGKGDVSGHQHMMLGLLYHGSRRACG